MTSLFLASYIYFPLYFQIGFSLSFTNSVWINWLNPPIPAYSHWIPVGTKTESAVVIALIVSHAFSDGGQSIITKSQIIPYRAGPNF